MAINRRHGRTARRPAGLARLRRVKYAMGMTPEQHRRPLQPGEIRAHTVGAQTFTVMHVAGGSFTQASVREAGKPTQVLGTRVDARQAVALYADAIEQAESDAVDALDGADGPSFTASGAFIPSAPDLTFNTPMGADMTLVTGESQAASSLADDVAALRTMLLDLRDDIEVLAAHADMAPITSRRAQVSGLAMLARIDRIAARVPQRATAGAVVYPWWLHDCGYVEIGDRDGAPPQVGPCTKCDDSNGTWRALYTLGGE